MHKYDFPNFSFGFLSLSLEPASLMNLGPPRLPRLKRDDSLSGREDSKCSRRELPEGMEQSIASSNVDVRLQKAGPSWNGVCARSDRRSQWTMTLKMRRNAELVVIDLAGAYSARLV
jgi:hypothetical protein